MSTRAADGVEALLARKRELVCDSGSEAPFQQRLGELRRWQAARLARTYADLRKNPRYAPAVDFFLNDLYGAHDFAARDQEMERAWRYLKRSLSDTPRRALARAIELDVLTEQLDRAMVAALASRPPGEESYGEAYRRVGDRRSRQLQIDLVIRVGEDLERAVSRAWIGALLLAAHAPARAAGFGLLQDFLERGYRAFKVMGGASEFLAAVRVRETDLMNALFSGAKPP